MSDNLLNQMINRSINPIKCNDKCEYWAFPHLDRPCVLSDIYGASAKGELCYDYRLKEAADEL